MNHANYTKLLQPESITQKVTQHHTQALSQPHSYRQNYQISENLTLIVGGMMSRLGFKHKHQTGPKEYRYMIV